VSQGTKILNRAIRHQHLNYVENPAVGWSKSSSGLGRERKSPVFGMNAPEWRRQIKVLSFDRMETERFLRPQELAVARFQPKLPVC